MRENAIPQKYNKGIKTNNITCYMYYKLHIYEQVKLKHDEN